MRILSLAVVCLAACGTTPPPPASAPASVASAAPATAAAPVTAAPATEPPPPKHECTVFVMGDPKTAFSATIEDKQFKQREKTSTEISMFTKVLQGDEMKRIELCDAFAKRKCPEAWRGDGMHCRMQMTVDAEADWGAATPVPKN